MKRLTAVDIELAVACHFGHRTTLMVPNVSTGWGLRYEADMVVVKYGFAMEIEIKVTASDIVADTRKLHGHDSNMFRMLWFAVPDALTAHPAIPGKAGIMAYCQRVYYAGTRSEYAVDAIEVRRAPAVNKTAKKLSAEQKFNLARLGTMRIWDLKTALMIRASRERLGQAMSRPSAISPNVVDPGDPTGNVRL